MHGSLLCYSEGRESQDGVVRQSSVRSDWQLSGAIKEERQYKSIEPSPIPARVLTTNYQRPGLCTSATKAIYPSDGKNRPCMAMARCTVGSWRMNRPIARYDCTSPIQNTGESTITAHLSLVLYEHRGGANRTAGRAASATWRHAACRGLVSRPVLP